MRHFTRIGVIENSRRIELLVRYRNDVVDYFNHVQFQLYGDPPAEGDAALAARRRINMETDEACDAIHAAGISTTMTYTPPPLIGGYVQNVELVHNIFNLHHFQASPQSLIDMIERAHGVYERNHRRALIRSFNPFFYLGLVLDALASSPFLLATRIGLPGKKLEDSILGVLVRVVVYVASAVASAIAILSFLGYADAARASIGQWFGI